MNLSNIQQKSRKEYYQRINRVVDYIDAHLDEEHNLEGVSVSNSPQTTGNTIAADNNGIKKRFF